jgi:hypothetical protein
MSSQAEARHRTAPLHLWGWVGAGALVAIAANLLVWGVAALAGVDIRIPERPGSKVLVPLSAPPLVFTTLAPVVAAGVAFWLLQTLTARPLRIFVAGAAILTGLSMAAPFSLDVEMAAKVALGSMHVLTATAIVAALTAAAGRAAQTEGSTS